MLLTICKTRIRPKKNNMKQVEPISRYRETQFEVQMIANYVEKSFACIGGTY